MTLPLTGDPEPCFEFESDKLRVAFDDVARFLDTSNVDDESRRWLLTAGSEQSTGVSNRLVALTVAAAAAMTVLLALTAGAAGSWLSVALVPVPLVLAIVVVGVRVDRAFDSEPNTGASTPDTVDVSDRVGAPLIGPQRPEAFDLNLR